MFIKLHYTSVMGESMKLGNTDNYMFVVRFDELAENAGELTNYMETNPRRQNLSSAVAKQIEESILAEDDPDAPYALCSRGILISAKSIKINKRSKTVILELDNKAIHGCIDGGHTFFMILAHRGENIPKEVKLEIITGITSREQVTKIAKARNTSTKVDNKSIYNMDGVFDTLKEIFAEEEFAYRISYMQNYKAYNDAGKLVKSIDARQVLGFIDSMDVIRYPGDVESTCAYNGKDVVLNRYGKHYAENAPKLALAKGVTDLVEVIQADLKEATNINGAEYKYGSKKFAKAANGDKTIFHMRHLEYHVPLGVVYPLLGAFRAIVVVKDGQYFWAENPVDVWNRHKAILARKLYDLSGDSASEIGRNGLLYKELYSVLATELAKERAAGAKKKAAKAIARQTKAKKATEKTMTNNTPKETKTVRASKTRKATKGKGRKA